MNENSVITTPAGDDLTFGTLAAYTYLASIGVTEFYANGRPKRFNAPVPAPEPPYVPRQAMSPEVAEELKFTPCP